MKSINNSKKPVSISFIMTHNQKSHTSKCNILKKLAEESCENKKDETWLNLYASEFLHLSINSEQENEREEFDHDTDLLITPYTDADSTAAIIQGFQRLRSLLSGNDYPSATIIVSILEILKKGMHTPMDTALIVESYRLMSQLFRAIPPVNDKLRQYWIDVLYKTLCGPLKNEHYERQELLDAFIKDIADDVQPQHSQATTAFFGVMCTILEMDLAAFLSKYPKRACNDSLTGKNGSILANLFWIDGYLRIGSQQKIIVAPIAKILVETKDTELFDIAIRLFAMIFELARLTSQDEYPQEVWMAKTPQLLRHLVRHVSTSMAEPSSQEQNRIPNRVIMEKLYQNILFGWIKMMDLPPTLELTDSQHHDTPKELPSPEPCWGRLLPLSKGFDVVDLREPTYTFGRGLVGVVDISFDNDLVKASHKQFPAYSQRHFRIWREESSSMSQTFIEDTSVNGTFVNDQKIGKDKRRVLNVNDEIALVSQTNKVYIYNERGISEYTDAPPELLENHIILKQLGRGAMGEVRLIFDKRTYARMAVKIVAKSKFLSPGGIAVDVSKHVGREIEILKSLDHPCIVKVYDIFDSPEKTFIIMELMEGGELFDRITKSSTKRLSEETAKLYFYHLLLAVKYLHDMNVTHRDLKPENILLNSHDEDTLVKITDFGLSKFVDSASMLKTFCGTPSYLAPEILQSHGTGTYTKAVDMWSLGVILFISLSGYMPFSQDYHDMSLKDQITTGRYKINRQRWQGVSSEGMNLVKKMLTVDPEKRPTADEALADVWMQDEEMKRKGHELMYPTDNGLTQLRNHVTAKRSADDNDDQETRNGCEEKMDVNSTPIKKPRCASPV